jgi:MFS family permease
MTSKPVEQPHAEGQINVPAVLMWVVLLASYVINAMDRQVYPLLVPDIRADYGFSLANAGLLSTVFTLGMGLAAIPAGYMLSRWSRKLTVLLGIFLYSAATLLTAFSFGFWDMFAYRAISGLGESMQLTALLAIAAAYFSRYRSTFIGSVNLCFGLGAIIGPALGGALLASHGSWRAPLIIFGLMGFVAILVVAVTVRRSLTESLAIIQERHDTRGANSIVNYNTILMSVITVIGGLIIYGYLGMYPTFLREDLGYSGPGAGAVMSIFGFGALASMICGWFGDRFPPRKVLGVCFLLVAVDGFLLFNGPTGFAAQATLSFIWGVLASATLYVNLAGYHVKAVRGDLSGKASALFVATLYIPAAFAGYIVGWIVEHSSWVTAGTIQLSLLPIVAALTVLALRPSRMALDTV